MGKKYDEKIKQQKKSYKVYPIKSKKDVERIKQYLRGSTSPADRMWLCLYIVGINFGLRSSDLSALKIGDVYCIPNGEVKKEINIIELKTGNEKTIIINNAAKRAIEDYLSTRGEIKEDDYLFLTQKRGKPSVKSINRKMKTLGKELNIPLKLGGHSLRKTWSYHLYLQNIGEDLGFIYTLQHMLGHTSVTTTMRYIDIDHEKLQKTYENLNL